MYTVEHEFDATIITVLDEAGIYEDVEVVLDEETVYMRQWDEDLGKYEMLILSYQQFLDIAASLHSKEGMFKVERQPND